MPAGAGRPRPTDGQGRSTGEDGAADATTSRFQTAVAGGFGQLGPAGQPAAHGLGLMIAAGTAGAAAGADITNQMGVGHTTYPPDFSHTGRRTSGDTHQHQRLGRGRHRHRQRSRRPDR